jgi:polyisoprenoid-binding protein YceI
MRIRHAARIAILFCVILAGAGSARAQAARGSLDVTFAVTSTLHDFEGTAGTLSVSLSQDATGAWSADVTVPVAQLKTGNDRRDESMRTMFDAAQHPLIRGRVRGVDPERVRSSGKLPLVLQIKDVEHPLEASVTHWEQSERTASFDVAFDVSLAAFQLEAPRILFVRVGDTVHVNVHLKLERT